MSFQESPSFREYQVIKICREPKYNQVRHILIIYPNLMADFDVKSGNLLPKNYHISEISGIYPRSSNSILGV